MKVNSKRAIRRHRSKYKFLRRVKLWLRDTSGAMNTIENREDVIAGKSYTFLRTTSSPCNCSMCTHWKYKRPTRVEVNKIIQEQLD